MHMEASSFVHDGLEGVVAAETELSHVDGHAGVLILRGHSVEQLAPRASVEDVCHLFWHGKLPGAFDRDIAPALRGGAFDRDIAPALRGGALERKRMQVRLYEGRARAYALLPTLGDALDAPNAMDALRAATAHLSEDAHEDVPALLTGALAVFTAAHHRRTTGKEPLAPNPDLAHAADFLAMLHGSAPDPVLVRALDTYLVTICDHGMNASTFAARVVASTASDMVSAVVAAIGALKGPLHGGAPGPVLDMLDAIGEPEHAEAWLRAELAAGRRIMGMGHRVYRVRDPRAAVLERAVRELAGHAHEHGRLTLARAVEDKATEVLDASHPDRKLRANVEFFTAVLLEAVGLDRRLFTATFAVGRVVGWCGHVLEQRSKGRLIRPSSRYVGPMPD
jgi:citrate synthase